jgi:hypothetical protein
MLVGVVIAAGGLVAIAQGVVGERRSRRVKAAVVIDPPGNQETLLVTEIEEWLRQGSY